MTGAGSPGPQGSPEASGSGSQRARRGGQPSRDGGHWARDADRTALVERQPEWWQVVSLGDHRLTGH